MRDNGLSGDWSEDDARLLLLLLLLQTLLLLHTNLLLVALLLLDLQLLLLLLVLLECGTNTDFAAVQLTVEWCGRCQRQSLDTQNIRLLLVGRTHKSDAANNTHKQIHGTHPDE